MRSALATPTRICVGCLLCIAIEPSAAVTGGAEPVGPSHRYSWLGAILQREALAARIFPFGKMDTPSGHRNDSQRPSLTSMDRFYLAIIALALLLLVRATGMFVTSTDLRPHAPTVGVAGSR